jgi:hypothetical protein
MSDEVYRFEKVIHRACHMSIASVSTREYEVFVHVDRDGLHITVIVSTTISDRDTRLAIDFLITRAL